MKIKMKDYWRLEEFEKDYLYRPHEGYPLWVGTPIMYKPEDEIELDG